MPAEDREIELAQRVMRLFSGGREPYAPAVWGMVQALADPHSRALIVGDIKGIRDARAGEAWQGSRSFRPYEEACDLLADLSRGEDDG